MKSRLLQAVFLAVMLSLCSVILVLTFATPGISRAIIGDRSIPAFIQSSSPGSTATKGQPQTQDAQPQEAQAEARKAGAKYFLEAGGDDLLGHYDLRYFKGQLEYEEHLTTLQNLARSWLTTTKALGIETWLAHGTLLGWWWNGRIMPWDYDLDVQVMGPTLAYLGENFNRSMHTWTYTNATTGEQASKEYLLDINPHHDDSYIDPMNVIDARWIDVENGMYIDITGLAERGDHGEAGAIWSCKNHHRYATADLYPLRKTEFEGVPAIVPFAFEKILIKEYQAKALTQTEFHEHIWNETQKEWVKEPDKTGRWLGFGAR